MGLPWHVCGWLLACQGMGIAGLSWLVKGVGAACLRARALMPWHGCGASAARAMGVSCAPAARIVGMLGAPMLRHFEAIRFEQNLPTSRINEVKHDKELQPHIASTNQTVPLTTTCSMETQLRETAQCLMLSLP
ncbi:hypothetical protein CJ030_MR2G000191 [Morella rubra]|uniref:Uncharacterized protein n=1 Tax=Morella rubra TaxID=262757 RepID=A0A6A1WKQ9_9ROSI|nr:hypothetical protein CJ030_MR2G000191 [Morella rubra]